MPDTLTDFDDVRRQLQAMADELHAVRQQQKAQPGWSRVWDVAVKALVPVVIAIVGWGIGHEIRVSNLELTAMSKMEGASLEQRMREQLVPAWLREDLAEIKQLLRAQDERIRSLQSRVK